MPNEVPDPDEVAFLEARNRVPDDELIARMNRAPDMGGALIVELGNFATRRQVSGTAQVPKAPAESESLRPQGSQSEEGASPKASLLEVLKASMEARASEDTVERPDVGPPSELQVRIHAPRIKAFMRRLKAPGQS